jgi:zinc protease
MRQYLTGLCLLALVFCAGSAAMAKTIFPYKVHTEVLPNGLKVVMIPMEAPGLVAYYSVVRTGSRDEVEPGKSGFAHFFEHMMFRGTKKFPGAVYDSIVTSIGASANAFTSDDITAYHLNFAVEDLEKVIDIESDRFQNLHYEQSEFQTEAGAIYGEYRKSITSPFSVLDEKVRDVAFDVHTYKHTTIGFERDIKAMPEAFEYSHSFFRRFYRPENVVLLIVGDIQPGRVMKLITKYYSGWQPGYEAPKVLPEPPQSAERTAEVSYAGKTLPIIDIAYKGDAFNPKNRSYVAAVMLGELAFGSTSDLYKQLYIKEQRVDVLDASIAMNRDMPLFEIVARVKNEDDLPAVRDEVYAAIASFQSAPVDPQRLANAKKRRTYGFLMNLDTPNKVAGNLAMTLAITGGSDAINEYYTEIDNVTPDDIMNAARHYFVPERRTVVVLKGARQ